MKSWNIIALCLLLAACATQPSPKPVAVADSFERQDTIKPLNEAIFAFNLKADTYVIKPVAETYHQVPDIVRGGVSNFLSNLHEPAHMVNGVIQLNPDITFTAFWRFMLNTTFGFAGVRDFAGENGLHEKGTNFGKTLRHYHVGEGAYVVLPILGSSTVRGTTGLVVDTFLDPVGYVLSAPLSIAKGVSSGIVAREENADIIDQLYYKSLDPYSATRAAYLQHQALE